MSSNPLYMTYGRWRLLYSWLGLPSRPLRQPVSADCTRWLCGRRLWLVTNAHAHKRGVRENVLHKLTTFAFTCYRLRSEWIWTAKHQAAFCKWTGSCGFPTGTATFWQNYDRQYQIYGRVIKILILCLNFQKWDFQSQIWHYWRIIFPRGGFSNNFPAAKMLPALSPCHDATKNTRYL